jgi:hypothetical protein
MGESEVSIFTEWNTISEPVELFLLSETPPHLEGVGGDGLILKLFNINIADI